MIIPRTWWVAGVIAVTCVAVAASSLLVPKPVPDDAVLQRSWDSLPRRVVVEVLNSGGVAGAGRAGTLLLRRAGLDVVNLANADSAHRGRVRNQVLVRRGDTTGVGRALEALGDAEVITAPDSTRLVDLTVLLGKEFRVPKGY
jgi:hypothetical protein